MRGRGFGDRSAQLRDECLEAFIRDASRYSRPVYERKLAELGEKVENHLLGLYRQILKLIYKDVLQAFGESISTPSGSLPFVQKLRAAYRDGLERFEGESRQCIPFGYQWEEWWSGAKLELEGELDTLAAQARQSELAKREAQLVGQFRKRLSAAIGLLFVEPDEAIWGSVWQKYRLMLVEHLEAIKRVHRELDLDGGVLQEGLLRGSTYAILLERLKEETSDTLVQVHLKRRFDAIFKHDKHGVPRIWEPSHDIGRIFEEAKASAHQLLDHLTVFDSTAVDEINDDTSPVELIDPTRRERILAMVDRDFDSAYIDAKRSILRVSSTIPWWIYLVILILGWNEIMAVLRSPLLLLLLVLTVAGVVVIHFFGAWSLVWHFWHRALAFGMDWAVQVSNAAKQPSGVNSSHGHHQSTADHPKAD